MAKKKVVRRKKLVSDNEPEAFEDVEIEEEDAETKDEIGTLPGIPKKEVGHVTITTVEGNPDAWREAGSPEGAPLYAAKCEVCGAYVASVPYVRTELFTKEHTH